MEKVHRGQSNIILHHDKCFLFERFEYVALPLVCAQLLWLHNTDYQTADQCLYVFSHRHIIMKILAGLGDWTNFVFTGRKRSLGQGNIFTPVCHSVYGGSTWAGSEYF